MEEIIETVTTNIWYIKLDENNRIVALQREIAIEYDENGELLPSEYIQYDFPIDFDLMKVHDYLLVDGELVYSEREVIEVEPVPTLEDRVTSTESSIADIENAMCENDMVTDSRIASIEDALCEITMLMEG